ncbi:hypothetical protein P7K49_032614 [Saguinus oedipus]|uniref:Fibronectin type-III domain-containing protein n=1 Tax=Saguinus oedipus TaxID=9490 RepID=A0ABQ9TZW6_SAGOE|nr:hypothetical protein P7K49_032614 [Saguinus oedipus]
MTQAASSSFPVPIGRIVVSNVTSTGFHLAWEAGLALGSAFQLTLTSAWSPTVVLETWNTSVTLSGLEPGVLHLVEIVAKVCGKGARARLKLRGIRPASSSAGTQQRPGRRQLIQEKALGSLRAQAEGCGPCLEAAGVGSPVSLWGCSAEDTCGARLLSCTHSL